MKSLISFALCPLILLSCKDSHDSPVNSPHMESTEIEAPIANSHTELARLFATAIDKQDSEMVASLMMPPELLGELETSKNDQKRYLEHLARVPQMVKMLHAHLAHGELLPLSGRPIQKHNSEYARIKTLNGKTWEQSTGIRVTNSEGQALYEIVDMAAAINGRWYIVQLLDPRTEEQIKRDLPEI